MYILIPPSEGKAPDPPRVAPKALDAALAKDLRGVLDHLAGLEPRALARFLKLRDAGQAEAVRARNMDALRAPMLPALERYTGVVYENLCFRSLRRKAQAGRRLLIVSGLFGLIAGGTPIPDYKLPINPWLCRYWRDTNAARLERLAKGAPVLSLLPQAHADAIKYTPLLHVDFRVAGGAKAAGHFGKAIKGKFLRFLIESGARGPADFHAFAEDGYRFDGENFVRD